MNIKWHCDAFGIPLPNRTKSRVFFDPLLLFRLEYGIIFLVITRGIGAERAPAIFFSVFVYTNKQPGGPV